MGVIKGSGRREMEDLRRAPDSESRAFVNNLEVILRRVAGSSLQEIDRLVGELQTIRELVETEGLSLKHRSTLNVALVCNVLPTLTLCDGELALNARTMGKSAQMLWSKQLAFTITPKSGPMRSMETLLDANRAISEDLPKGSSKRHQWFSAGTLLVRASITGSTADIQKATDALVKALDSEGWMSRGVSTPVLLRSSSRLSSEDLRVASITRSPY